jgi:hypothetical protein
LLSNASATGAFVTVPPGAYTWSIEAGTVGTATFTLDGGLWPANSVQMTGLNVYPDLIFVLDAATNLRVIITGTATGVTSILKEV